MKQFYETYAGNEIVSPLVTQLSKCGFDIGRLEGVMYQLYARDIGFIIENLEK